MLTNIRFSTFKPRNNFSAPVARKRGESNYISAFRRSFLGQFEEVLLSGSEFAMSGYGIADLICVTFEKGPRGEGSALTIEGIRQRLEQETLCAFELKLDNWKRALYQAYRYSYFSNKAVVVLPPSAVSQAVKKIDLFRDLNVGLWEFDAEKSEIRKVFDPTACSPRNSNAYDKALALILRKINFRKSRESLNALL